MLLVSQVIFQFNKFIRVLKMPNFVIYFSSVIIVFSYVESFILRRSLNASCHQFCRMGRSQCFEKRYWCNLSRECLDGMDEIYCKKVHPNCGNILSNCQSGECLPKYWFCDGEVDCTDGSDEDCIDGERQPFLTSAKYELRKWILDQRSNSWGWEKDTPRAIVAMYLMNVSEYSSGNPNNTLAAKELEAQLSFEFFRSHNLPLEETKMAHYIHAMLATCNDPRHFHGFNMVLALDERISKLKFIRPITLLALCNAGHPLLKHHIDKLKEIIAKPNDPIWIDTKALATMALICAVNQTDDKSLNRTIFNSLLTLKSLQNTHGSFGDARTSALTMQALISNSDYNGWDFPKAMRYISGQRRSDSSGMLTNYLIMPLLSKHTLLDLGKVNCEYTNRRGLRNITLRETMGENLGEKIHVQYSIRVGDKEDVSHTSTFRIPVNTSFFDVMRLASELYNRYSFQWRYHHSKKYIYSMSSIDNDPELRKYWTLYKMRHGEKPLLVQQGVDDVYPKDREHFVFWYKTVIEDKLEEHEGNSTVIGL